MAFQLSPIIEAQFAPATQTTLYTSPVGQYTRIDSLSVVNTGTVAETIGINVVANAGTAGASSLTTVGQSIQPNQTWNSPNEIGKVLAPGDFISVIASTGSVLVISAGGLIQL